MTFDYEILLKITRDVPDNLDKKQKKEKISPQVRADIIARDHNTCKLCGYVKRPEWTGRYFGDIHIHHIIPNGPANPDNLITLCENCHIAVHKILYVSGKWKIAHFTGKM